MSTIPIHLRRSVACLIVAGLTSVALAQATRPAPPLLHPIPATESDTPLSYKDAKSGIIIYVELDRRTISAIDADGKLLWTDNIPARCFNKSPRMAVAAVGAPPGWMSSRLDRLKKPGDYVHVNFSEHQEQGVVNLRTGAYIFMGDDVPRMGFKEPPR